MIAKKNIINLYYIFLIFHLLIWTLIPTFSNENLPLDTIEALAWGSNMDWGFNKHPPLSAFAVEIIYQLFGNQDWSYYLLSQIFLIITFIVIFKLALELFSDHYLSLLSVLLLEGIYFYNYTTPEFNVNITQLPFWALSIFYSWKCIKNDKFVDYILLGIFIGLGILSKYLFLYLVLSIKLLFLYLLINKNKFKFRNLLIVGPVVILVTFPHLIWLYENDFITISYGFQRTGGIGSFWDHFSLPLIFIGKQLSVLVPFAMMAFFLLKRYKVNFKIKDKKVIFLFFTFLCPIILVILTSIIFGVKIRTMWMTPFYVLTGVFFVEIFKKNIKFDKFKKFIFIFFLFFTISPLSYLIVSLSNDFKRTDYQGKEIARLVQNKWDDNFSSDIKIVVGDEWFAGNLSYHLKTRPKWFIELNKETLNSDLSDGVIYTGNPKVLKQICPGVFGTIKPVGYCMIGRR